MHAVLLMKKQTAALTEVIKMIVPGKKIVDICVAGDKHLETECAKYYNKKVEGAKVEKGVAIPTCVSVNEQVSYNCPEVENKDVLEEGPVSYTHLTLPTKA